MSTYISRFNPYTMDDETILAVATGRKQPLRMVMDDLEEMLQGDGQTSHLLVAGPRGIGKSFFARYLQIMFKRAEVFNNCKFILFPEEQSNIQFPSDLVRMVLSQLEEGGKFEQVFTRWEESEADWRESYSRLKTYIEDKRTEHGKFLLVALVENMDELVQRFSGAAEGRFREMLEKLPCFVLIGATPKPDFDRDYNKPLFHAFKKYKLNRWKEEDFLSYFTRRRIFEEARTGMKYSPERISLMENKLRAISLFTGGSPRMAAVLSNLLLRDDLFSTANTLRGLIDELTPYYQDLIKSIPPQSRKLFDTLIRAGENLSQTELAVKLGTSQSNISKAFGWLQENDYIRGEKREGANSFRYLVNDRIFCLYYKTREVYHDQDYSPIWLLADLLVAYYEGDELRQKAMGHLQERFDMDSRELAKVSLYARGIPRELLPKEGDREYWMGLLEEEDTPKAVAKIAMPGLKKIEHLFYLQKEEDVLKELKPLLAECNNFLLNKNIGKKVATILEGIAATFGYIYFNSAANEILVETKKYWEITNNNKKLAYNYNKTGWNLFDSNHIEAAEMFDKAQTIWSELGNELGQAINLSSLGNCLYKLGNYKESLDKHQKSYTLFKHQEFQYNEARCLHDISKNLEKLERFEEAIELQLKGYLIEKEEEDVIGQAWHLGHLGKNLLLLNRFEEAWEKLIDTNLPKEEVFRQYGDGISSKNDLGDRTGAFSLAKELLLRLKESETQLDTTACLVCFFADLISTDIPYSLLQDICEEALTIFSTPAHQTIIQATLSTVEYLNTGKQKSYLEKLPPDTAIIVEAIVNEGEL